jgi:hypothetical protein
MTKTPLIIAGPGLSRMAVTRRSDGGYTLSCPKCSAVIEYPAEFLQAGTIEGVAVVHDDECALLAELERLPGFHEHNEAAKAEGKRHVH